MQPLSAYQFGLGQHMWLARRLDITLKRWLERQAARREAQVKDQLAFAGFPALFAGHAW